MSMAAKKAAAIPKAKSSGPIPWDKDDEMYPKKNTHCKVCGRYGEMKLAWDRREYLCMHAGKCIARAARVRAGEDVDNEPEG